MKTALILVLATSLAGCRSAAPPQQPPQQGDAQPGAQAPGDHGPQLLKLAPDVLSEIHLRTDGAGARQGGEIVQALGNLHVNEDAYAEVGSSIPGRVSRLAAGPGDLVTSGQPLVEIESVELGRARATFASTRARAELARQSLKRKEALSARIVPARELQEAEADAKAAEADFQSARSALRALGIGDAEAGESSSSGMTFTLRSPIAGTVIERKAVLGQLVDTAQPLYRVADLSTLWLVAQVGERDALRLSPETAAVVTIPSLPDAKIGGRVALIGAEVDPQTRSVPVRIVVQNVDGRLRPGMSAGVWLSEGSGPAVTVLPSAALQRIGDGWCVFIPTDDTTMEVRPVGRGRDLGAEVEILSGVKLGEKVVVEGAFLLKAELEKASGAGDED